jgi:DNA repair exonuclease SbcCD ATPase subunit
MDIVSLQIFLSTLSTCLVCVQEEEYRTGKYGTTNGTFKGKTYFTCKDGCGLFVALNSLSPVPANPTTHSSTKEEITHQDMMEQKLGIEVQEKRAQANEITRQLGDVRRELSNSQLEVKPTIRENDALVEMKEQEQEGLKEEVQGAHEKRLQHEVKALKCTIRLIEMKEQEKERLLREEVRTREIIQKRLQHEIEVLKHTIKEKDALIEVKEQEKERLLREEVQAREIIQKRLSDTQEELNHTVEEVDSAKERERDELLNKIAVKNEEIAELQQKLEAEKMLILWKSKKTSSRGSFLELRYRRLANVRLALVPGELFTLPNSGGRVWPSNKLIANC